MVQQIVKENYFLHERYNHLIITREILKSMEKQTEYLQILFSLCSHFGKTITSLRYECPSKTKILDEKSFNLEPLMAQLTNGDQNDVSLQSRLLP